MPVAAMRGITDLTPTVDRHVAALLAMTMMGGWADAMDRDGSLAMTVGCDGGRGNLITI